MTIERQPPSAHTRSCSIYQDVDKSWRLYGIDLKRVTLDQKTGTKIYRRMRSRAYGTDDKMALSIIALEQNAP